MKHAEDDLIRNDIPVVCYEIDGESELPFIDNGKSYGYKFANIDLDYTGKAYMGFCYGQPRMSFGDLKKRLNEECGGGIRKGEENSNDY